MPFIPQAIADETSKSVLFVFTNEEYFNRNWKDKVKTVDAPGVEVHPADVRVGDVVDWFQTGWNKERVLSVVFSPDMNDKPGWHRSGSFTFETRAGFLGTRIDGRIVLGPKLFRFSV